MKDKVFPLEEDVAGSYSGVVDIIQTDKSSKFLKQLDDCYQQAKKDQERLEKELEQIKRIRGNCVTLWLHSMKFLKKDSLCYLNKNNVVHIKKLDDNRIDYDKFELDQL